MTVVARFRLNWTLVQNLAVMYGGSVASGVVQYAALIVLARGLGPDNLGVVVLTTSIASFTAAAVEFGISPVLVRFRPELEEDDPEMWAAVIRSMARIVGATAAVISVLALVALSLATVVPLSAGAMRAVTLGLAIAVPTIVLTFFQGYLQSYRRFREIALLSIGGALARLSMIVTLALAHSLSVASVLAVYLVTACTVASAAWQVTIRRADVPAVSRATRRRARALVAPYLRWTMAGRASVALNGRLDIFLLSILAGAAATGVYGAASQSATPFPMLATAVGEVSFPHFAARHRGANTRGIIHRWASWLPVLVIGSTAAALAGAYILPSVLGTQFEQSSAPFAVLVTAYGLQIWLQPIAALLYASNRQRPAASIAVAQTLMVAALDMALIPAYGALGPALAILITIVLTAPLMVAAALRQGPSSAGAPELPVNADT
jgi:O-antigen/teichoic acid export membrane protein